MALQTIQSNLKTNTKDYNKFSYFLQGIDVTQQNLNGFDPYIQGTSRIFLYTPPFFMTEGFLRSPGSSSLSSKRAILV